MTTDNRKLKKLPNEYTDILPFRLPDKVNPTLVDGNDVLLGEQPSLEDIEADDEWLNDPNPSLWAAFHAQRGFHVNKLKEDISALLPIWSDDSKSPATIKHVLRVLKKAVNFLNPGQPIVSTLDQPLFAIAERLHSSPRRIRHIELRFRSWFVACRDANDEYS